MKRMIHLIKMEHFFRSSLCNIAVFKPKTPEENSYIGASATKVIFAVIENVGSPTS